MTSDVCATIRITNTYQ